MNRIIAAQVIARSKIKEFNEHLKAAIELGWQPLGPASESGGECQSYFSMTLVKYDESVEPPPVRKIG